MMKADERATKLAGVAFEKGKKAGMQKVVDWVEKQGKYENVVIYPIYIYGADWEDKKKEWDLSND